VWSETGPLRYERLTWPEVRRAAAQDRVALVPVATLEDHGPHLPVDTDLRIVAEICARAAARVADRVVLLPAIPHGYDPHHMDFPGAITIGWDTFTRYCADVGPLPGPPRVPADAVPQRPRLQPEPGRDGGPPWSWSTGPRCWPRPRSTWPARRRSRSSAGSGSRAAAAWATPASWRPGSPWPSTRTRWPWTWPPTSGSYPEGPNAWLDWSDGSLKLMPWWSSFSRSGVQGDATLGTAAKGEALLEAAVAECVAYVDELLAKPLPRRRAPAAGDNLLPRAPAAGYW
jgi:creatinine amidohydrolase